MKEVFISEWLYKPIRGHRDKDQESGVIRLRLKNALEPYQLYLVKLFKVVISTKDDYNELMMVMRNIRPNDRKIIMKHIEKLNPGENKIKNVRLGG